jgi:hypothetical protein
MSGAQVPVAVGMSEDNKLASRIDPDFEQRNIPEASRFYLKRCVGFHDQLGEKYLMFVPVIGTKTGGDRYCSSQSIVYVYDYTRDSWWTWNNVNFASGIIAYDKDVYFSEKRLFLIF